VRLSRVVFRTTFRLFRLVFVRILSDVARDDLAAFYATMSVVLLQFPVALIESLRSLLVRKHDTSPLHFKLFNIGPRKCQENDSEHQE
jgi:hypothetical protein